MDVTGQENVHRPARGQEEECGQQETLRSALPSQLLMVTWSMLARVSAGNVPAAVLCPGSSCQHGGACDLVHTPPVCRCPPFYVGNTCQFVRMSPDVVKPLRRRRLFLPWDNVIACRFNVQPPPSRVVLRRNKIPLNLNYSRSREDVVTGAVSYVWKVDREGGYQCEVENVYGVAISDVITTSFISFHADSKMHEVSLIIHQYVRLDCSLNPVLEGPKLYFSWLKDEHQLVPSVRHHIDITGDLHILNTTQRDDGRYTCGVSVNRTSWHALTTTVLQHWTAGTGRRKREAIDKAETILILEKTSYAYGENMEMECLCVGSVPSFYDMIWTRPSGVKVNGSRLVIHSLNHTDEGTVTCERTPRTQTALEGSTVVLECCGVWSNDSSLPLKVTWFINTRKIADVTRPRYMRAPSGLSLTFDNVTILDNILVVQCNITDVDERVYLYHNIAVRVIVPMQVQAERVHHVIFPRDHNISLRVLVQADPAVKNEFVWMFKPRSSARYEVSRFSLNKSSVDIPVNHSGDVNLMSGTYVCHIINHLESQYVAFEVLVSSREDEVVDVALVSTGVALPLVLVVVVAVVVYIKRQTIKQAWKKREIKNSIKFRLELSRMNQSPWNVKHPANSDEFSVDRLHFLETLGSGNFGKVVKAEALDLNGSGKWELIAVKMCKDTATDAEKENMCHETVIMRKIIPHINVVTYLGYVSSSDPSLLLMEYVSGGNLLSFLRKRRPPSVQRLPGDREDIQAGLDTREENLKEVEELLSSRDLSFLSLQIANGMEHLTRSNIIHRDLAARNVLLDVGNVCKISDFGLARDLEGTNSGEYEVTTMGPLPIRWMSPESLTDGLFTVKSDVWSYGVLLWEMVTMGQFLLSEVANYVNSQQGHSASPFCGKTTRQVMTLVKGGNLLEKPDCCADCFYDVMLMCWQAHHGDRPSFSDLSDVMERHLEDEVEYVQLADLDTNVYDVIKIDEMERLEERV